MYLQLPWTDPATGAAYPAACLQIEDARCHQSANHAQLEIAIYADATTAQPASQKGPVFRDSQVILTPADIVLLWGSFQLLLYTILQQRSEFAGGTIVT